MRKMELKKVLKVLVGIAQVGVCFLVGVGKLELLYNDLRPLHLGL